MELGDQAAKHISKCKLLSDGDFAVLARCTVEALLGVRPMEESAAASVGNNEAEAGIAILVLEAAKGGIEAEDLEALVNEEYDIGAPKAKALADLYAEYKSKLTDGLRRHARASPVSRLVDFKWRADHVISSSEDAASQSNQFHVTWKTVGNAAAVAKAGESGTFDEVRFTLNRDQMQHMVGKLKDALRAAEQIGEAS